MRVFLFITYGSLDRTFLPQWFAPAQDAASSAYEAGECAQGSFRQLHHLLPPQKWP